jgi:hypothetical protein
MDLTTFCIEEEEEEGEGKKSCSEQSNIYRVVYYMEEFSLPHGKYLNS